MALESIAAFAAARKVCTDVLQRIDTWEVRYQQLEARRIELTQLPMNEASAYWHQEVYLYLIHPTRDGYRSRKYIGNNPNKVKEALDAILHFKQHKAICNEVQRIKNQLMEAQFSLQQCLLKLEDRDFHEGLLS